ncbi:hypothetical protein [Flavobacterium facile]|uniref:hypothetical protein n=1 Tax=Flavobacterium facile TaxID=2893174 RepID=UPI002E76E32A|nr:hypothetical protein [Flavobacterium sp. T-12]
MTTTPKAPIKYNGTGSAVDNYLSETPEESKLNFAAFDIKNSQHRYIMSLCHTMGWTKTLLSGKEVANMETFGIWLQNKSPIQMPLTEMNPKQTSKVIFAFEKVVKHLFK